MNTETGQVYQTQSEVNAALERGETVVPISRKVARIVAAGTRAQRRKAKRKTDKFTAQIGR